MSTGKCHRGVTWSCDSWWNPAILLNLSMLCWSIYNSCLKSLVSSKINFFVIVQRGISKTSLKALDVVLLSTSDSLKLYQFTTQVAPPFSEQYLQEGFWQLTEYLVADKEILCKTPTWLYVLSWGEKKEAQQNQNFRLFSATHVFNILLQFYRVIWKEIAKKHAY